MYRNAWSRRSLTTAESARAASGRGCPWARSLPSPAPPDIVRRPQPHQKRMSQARTTMHTLRGLAAASAVLLAAACGGGNDAGKAGTPDSAAAAPQGAAAPTTGQPQAGGTPGGDPGAVLGKMPAQVRGIYLNAYSLGPRLKRQLEIADQTEINTFVVDVKDERG